MNCGNNKQCSKLKVQKKNDPTNFFYSELEMLNNDILNLNKIKISLLYFFYGQFLLQSRMYGINLKTFELRIHPNHLYKMFQT